LIASVRRGQPSNHWQRTI